MSEEQMGLVLEYLQDIRAHIDDMKLMFDAADRSLTRIEVTFDDIEWLRDSRGRTMTRLDRAMDRLSRDVDDIKLCLGIAH